jgi:enoyl-CoA hydratase/carnithine racemase
MKEYAEVYATAPRLLEVHGVFAGAIDSVRNCGKPVIARLNGVVAGGGNEFNLAADLAVAADHITLRQVGTRWERGGGGATQWLPITIGDRRAREMLFTCDEITAQQALDWGWSTGRASRRCGRGCGGAGAKIIDKFRCTRYTKQQVNFWKDLSWYSTVGHARDWLSLHFMSPEPYEGMTAFVEKRSPRYRDLRQRAAEGRSSEFLWGPYTRACGACGAKGIPEEFAYCGKCGARLT